MTIQDYIEYQGAEILALYAAVGWTNYTDRPEMLRNAYANSLLTLGAYEGNKLVGLLRAVGDGYSIVFVQDILVLPDYQRRGIGTALLKELMGRYPEVYQLQLLTDATPEHVAFYETLGFRNGIELGCAVFMKV